MKNLPIICSTGASLLSLIVGIWLFFIGSGSRDLVGELQELQQQAQTQQVGLQEAEQKLRVQQQSIDAGNQISNQVGPELLRDMAAASPKNKKMEDLLAKHGYTVQFSKNDAESAPSAQP